ncbi:MAG: CocE/NonD family hydrolase, partial [Pseudomonadota bacterium]
MKNPKSNEGSKAMYEIKAELNTRVKMRDGVRLACNIYRPDADEKFPALLAISPYGKDGQMQKIPPRPFTPDYAHIEAGNTEFFVSRGYVHVIADGRGSGHSDGKYDICSRKEQEDGYDLIEWIAEQPWCNGNVGMVGISYFALIQYLIAAQQPPHLKAIFPHDGWGDMYRDVSHHGGILMQGWLRNWVQGGNMLAWNAEPASEKIYSKKELRQKIEKWKSNEVVQKSPTLYNTLEFPHSRPTLFDWLINEFDGEYYWERSASTKYDQIKIPVFLGSEMHHYPVIMHLPGAFRAFEGIDAPKRLVIRPSVPERPFHEFHDEIVAWYDYWLKGIDTGIMDEPPIKIWVRQADDWRCGDEWPLRETRWTDYYLRSDNNLEKEKKPATEEKPDTFNHKPVLPLVMARFFMDPKPEHLSFSTEPLGEDTEVVGPIALYLYASIATEDADFIVKVKDVNPDGTEFVLSRGWLKASHRALDKERSKPWQ